MAALGLAGLAAVQTGLVPVAQEPPTATPAPTETPAPPTATPTPTPARFTNRSRLTTISRVASMDTTPSRTPSSRSQTARSAVSSGGAQPGLNVGFPPTPTPVGFVPTAIATAERTPIPTVGAIATPITLRPTATQVPRPPTPTPEPESGGATPIATSVAIATARPPTATPTATATPMPTANLVAAIPEDWLSAVRIEPMEAQPTTAFLSGRPVRIAWAIRNDGPDDITVPFGVGIFLDDLALIEYPVEGLGAGKTLVVEDSQAYLYGEGEAIVRLKADHLDEINELSEEDNEAEETILIALPAPTPTATPEPAAFNLRFSELTLTSAPQSEETVLVDYAVVNDGKRPVGSGALIEFRLAGQLRAVVETYDLGPGESFGDSDLELGEAPEPGSALIEATIRPVDSAIARSETDRDDNRLSVRIEWQPAQADLWRDAEDIEFDEDTLEDAKQILFGLINQERERASLQPVSLAQNPAAQRHAESMLSGCFLSHWDQDGLKPYMRSGLGGSAQYSRENGSGLSYCYDEDDRVEPITEIEPRMSRLMDGWMASAGHRANILNPRHRRVSLGLAWNRHNLFGTQLFEGDYVEMESLPRLDRGRLTVAGTLRNGATLRNDQDLSVRVYFDPPPRPLERGQLARTYCYALGPQIIQLRAPLQPGQIYQLDTIELPHVVCPDPTAVSPDTPAPDSPAEANAVHQAAYQDSLSDDGETAVAAFVTADLWQTGETSFRVSADISETLKAKGPGVYTVTIQARLADEFAVVSEYPLYHLVSPPVSWTAE